MAIFHDSFPIAIDGNSFVDGELFITQNADWVSVSGEAAGVAGDTIQKGEVLDLDFFDSNPFGFVGNEPTAQASATFFKFDGVNSEDLVVILKLIDPDDNTRTTRAINVDNADIYRDTDLPLPEPYSFITLDNNDGVAIIEGNDYNINPGENYVIEGAQIIVSTEDVTGTAINLNRDLGELGGSSTFQEFEGTPGDANPEVDSTDNDVLKIADIGFIQVDSGNLNADLAFELSVIDADGDTTTTQTLNVDIINGTTFSGTDVAESIQGTTGDD